MKPTPEMLKLVTELSAFPSPEEVRRSQVEALSGKHGPTIIAILQRDLRTAQRWTTGYRRLALLGWLAFVGAMLWQPSAHADTLPAGSLACVDAATWEEQQNQTMFEPAVPGCVYTYHDFEVAVVAPGVVQIGDLQVWVYAAAVQP